MYLYVDGFAKFASVLLGTALMIFTNWLDSNLDSETEMDLEKQPQLEFSPSEVIQSSTKGAAPPPK